MDAPQGQAVDGAAPVLGQGHGQGEPRVAAPASVQADEVPHLRRALGRFTTGVTIVCCVGADGAFVGLTVNSFGSLSLDPPLVHWSIRLNSPSRPAFETAQRFSVNVLAQPQMALARRFAARRDDRFDEGEWSLGLHGAPVLAGCDAVFECDRVSRQDAGDHCLFIGRVLACSSSTLPPLVFQAGHFHRLGELL
jgi:flavin reductase (DIM6/NTAB) family NADH-FMN oxidoreductase RutF